MLQTPERRAFSSRDDFAGAVTECFAQLYEMYEAEPVRALDPEWVASPIAYNVALPIDVARQGGDAHGLSSLLKHAIEMHKSIERIARVERDRKWIVWAEMK